MEDFVAMQQYGVGLVRVPTGYWNWVDLGDATPNAPDNVAWRLRNLQSVSSVGGQAGIYILPEISLVVQHQQYVNQP